MTARLLRVTLRTQPSDTAIAVHPLVNFGFAFETLNVDRFDTRIRCEDIPIPLGNSHRFEIYFCFRHPLFPFRLQPELDKPVDIWLAALRRSKKFRSRASSTICSPDKIALTNGGWGAVCISYRWRVVVGLVINLRRHS
jgi:hypothetical protein